MTERSREPIGPSYIKPKKLLASLAAFGIAAGATGWALKNATPARAELGPVPITANEITLLRQSVEAINATNQTYCPTEKQYQYLLESSTKSRVCIDGSQLSVEPIDKPGMVQVVMGLRLDPSYNKLVDLAATFEHATPLQCSSMTGRLRAFGSSLLAEQGVLTDVALSMVEVNVVTQFGASNTCDTFAPPPINELGR